MLVLTKVKLGIILSLFIALSLLAWQYRAEVRAAARQTQVIAQQVSTIGSLSHRLDVLEVQHENTLALLAASNLEHTFIQDYYSETFNRLDDEEYLNWISNPLPASIQRLQSKGIDGY